MKSWLAKPRVVDYSRHATYLPGRIAEYIKVGNHDIRKERMKWLISLLATYDITEINEEFYELVGSLRFFRNQIITLMTLIGPNMISFNS